MALKPDFQDALQAFIYSNLPILMNPNNAKNVVISNNIFFTTAITATTPTVPIPSISATQTISTAPVIVIPPEFVEALQSYILNNFPNIGLPQDIQQVAKNFFANLPPIIPIARNTAVPVTAVPVTTVPVTTTTFNPPI